MPRRTNEFQRLVYLVKQQAAAGAAVTESKMLIDRLTGSEREVDVSVETSVAGHPLLIAIECCDHRRDVDVTWVEQMKCKHERLPTNALVLASRRGFTPEAVRLAEACGIETLFLEEENTDTVGRLLGACGKIWKNFYQAQPTKVKVSVLPPDSTGPIVVRCHPSTQLVDTQRRDAGSVDALVAKLLGLTPIRAYFESQGKPEHHYFEFKWTLPAEADLFLRKLKPDRLEQVTLLHVIGTLRFDPATFQMRQARLGATSFLWGVGSTFGNQVVAVASETPSGQVVSLSVIEKNTRRMGSSAPKGTAKRRSKAKKKVTTNRRKP